MTLTNSAANNVAVTNSSLLTLGNVSVGSGTLSLKGAGLTQVGGTSILQAASAGAVTLDGGNGTIGLANAGNDFTGAVC